MAISRFEVKVGQKGLGLAHFLYISAEGKYRNKADEVVYKNSGNIPRFAKTPEDFWAAADEYERKNGSVYREHLISLPRELTREQNKKLVDEWIDKHISNFAYSYAYHETKARDGGIQPHVHLMFSERKLDAIERSKEQFFKRYNPKRPESGGAKKENTGKNPTERRKELKKLREDWGEHLRQKLMENGYRKSANLVNMKNWKERNVEPPEPKKPVWIIQAEKERAQAQNEINNFTDTPKLINDLNRSEYVLDPNN